MANVTIQKRGEFYQYKEDRRSMWPNMGRY